MGGTGSSANPCGDVSTRAHGFADEPVPPGSRDTDSGRNNPKPDPASSPRDGPLHDRTGVAGDLVGEDVEVVDAGAGAEEQVAAGEGHPGEVLVQVGLEEQALDRAVGVEPAVAVGEG